MNSASTSKDAGTEGRGLTLAPPTVKSIRSFVLDANSTNVAKVLASELTVDVEADLEIVRDGIVGVYLDGRFLGEVRKENQDEVTTLISEAIRRSGKATANVGLYRGPRKNWAVLAPEGGPRMSVRAVVRELLRGGFPEASREPGFEVRTSDKERTGGSLRLSWARTGSLRGSDGTAAGIRSYKKSIEAMVVLLRRKGYSVKAGLKVDGIPVYFIHGWRPRAKKK